MLWFAALRPEQTGPGLYSRSAWSYGGAGTGGGRQSRKLRGPGVASGRTTMYYAVRGPDGRPLVLTMEWRDGHLGLSARVGGMCRVSVCSARDDPYVTVGGPDTTLLA